jgi:ribonuclease-3
MAKAAAEKDKKPVEETMAGLEVALGYSFRDRSLLQKALTHSSFAYEMAHHDASSPSVDNETLEFLGDAVLGLLAAEFLLKRFPSRTEGELTQMRASVISRRYLGKIGTALGLGKWLRLGPTAEANEGRQNPALCSNALEAILAALYLDGGLEAAREFAARALFAEAFPFRQLQSAAGLQDADSILDLGILDLSAAGSFPSAMGDWKSALKERLEAAGKGVPEYRLIAESGPAHRRSFLMEVWVNGNALAQAEAPSKKAAQQDAAHLALKIMARERMTEQVLPGREVDRSPTPELSPPTNRPGQRRD